MSSPTVLTVITTKLNAGQNAANTGAGAQNSDGSFNTSGTVLGTVQTVHATVELATLGKNVGSAVPLTGLGLSAASAGVAANNIQTAWSTGQPINQSDVAALIGGAAGMGGAIIVLMGGSGPILVTLTVASLVAGGYQLYASANGLTINPVTGQAVGVALTPMQMTQIDQHLQQTLPLWNKADTLPELGFVTGTKVQTIGSVFSAATSNTNDAPSPTGLDTPTRNSAVLINTTGAHTTQFNNGGGVDDLWVVEKNAGRYVGSLEQFRADFVASNGQVNPQTLGVQLGQTYYVPQRSANGDTVYHYSNGATVMNNTTTGEYHMVVPRADGEGGQTVYSRVADDFGYTVKQVKTNGAGAVVFEHQSYQNTLSADLSPVSTYSVSDNQTTTRNWLTDKAYQTKVYDSSNSLSSDTLKLGKISYNLFDLAQRGSAEYQLSGQYNAGILSKANWNSFTTTTSIALLGGGSGINPNGSSYGLQPPSNWLDPIGAFYDSQSSAYDNAATVAGKTLRAMNASGQALTAQQLAALDTNNDGSLSTTEAANVRLWSDANEGGRIAANVPLWKEVA